MQANRANCRATGIVGTTRATKPMAEATKLICNRMNLGQLISDNTRTAASSHQCQNRKSVSAIKRRISQQR